MTQIRLGRFIINETAVESDPGPMTIHVETWIVDNDDQGTDRPADHLIGSASVPWPFASFASWPESEARMVTVTAALHDLSRKLYRASGPGMLFENLPTDPVSAARYCETVLAHLVRVACPQHVETAIRHAIGENNATEKEDEDRKAR